LRAASSSRPLGLSQCLDVGRPADERELEAFRELLDELLVLRVGPAPEPVVEVADVDLPPELLKVVDFLQEREERDGIGPSRDGREDDLLLADEVIPLDREEDLPQDVHGHAGL
jgi:hypothetical protein